MNRIYTFFLLSFLTTAAWAQVTPQLFIDDTYTPEEMVMDFFANSNITPSNVTFHGSALSRGFFDAGTTTLPINAGIVLSTGRVSSLPGLPSAFSSFNTGTGWYDPDLANIATGGLSNTALLQFDILPEVDTISIFYIFGSEEYPEYVMTSFNDVFGFFISGGPEYPQPVNICLIPNSGLPVSINNLNHIANSAYFINWQSLGTGFCTLDGTTTLLEAKAAVTPGESYHIKIGIADVADAIFDSGIFIGMQSLGGDSLLTPPTNFAYSISGDTVFLENQSKYAMGFEWDFGDGTTSDQKSPGYHVFNSQNDIVNIQLKSFSWCCEGVKKQKFSLSGAPVPEFEAAITEICEGTSVQFFETSGENDILEWHWEFPGGEPATSTEPNPTVFYASPGVYDVRLSLTNAIGENSEEKLSYLSVASNQVAAQANFSFTQSGPLIQFSNASQNASSLSWTFGDGATSSLETPAHAFQDTGFFEVTLIVSNVCNADTLVQLVYMENYVDAQFSASPLSGCAPLAVQFTNETDHTTVSHWSLPGGDPAESSDPNPVVTYWQAGLYDVTLQAGTAPFSDAMQHLQFIEALPSPTAEFELSADGLMIGISNFSQHADQYHWDFGDGNTSADAEPAHTYAAPGNYLITLVAENGCGTDTATFNLLISGVGNAALTNQWFAVFPNPVTSWLSIHPLKTGTYGLRLLDATGRQLFARTELSGNTSIDMGSYPSGIYWLEVEINGEVFSRQLAKE